MWQPRPDRAICDERLRAAVGKPAVTASAAAAAEARVGDDPQRLRSPAYLAFFLRVLRRRLGTGFDAVRLAKPGVPAVAPDLPLIVYCNHPSWWDGALLPVVMAQLFPERATYGPIDADALQRYKFMRRLGFFGVATGTFAGAATFLRVGRALLARSDTLFCITPQGSFVDVRARPIRLQPGLAGLVSAVPRVTVLPLAIDYPFWDERTPEALLRFGTPQTMGRDLPASLIDAELQMQTSLTTTMDRLADDAMRRDAGRFDVLIAGRAGVGGVYDGWRRLRAWTRGERFDAAHAASRQVAAAAVVDTGHAATPAEPNTPFVPPTVPPTPSRP